MPSYRGLHRNLLLLETLLGLGHHLFRDHLFGAEAAIPGRLPSGSSSCVASPARLSTSYPSFPVATSSSA